MNAFTTLTTGTAAPVHNNKSLTRHQGSASHVFQLKLERRKRDSLLLNTAGSNTRQQKNVKNTSNEKSYLKTRRSQVRQERRTDILGFLDRNLEEGTNASELKSSGHHPTSSSSHHAKHNQHQHQHQHHHNSNIASASHSASFAGNTSQITSQITKNSSSSSSNSRQPHPHPQLKRRIKKESKYVNDASNTAMPSSNPPKRRNSALPEQQQQHVEQPPPPSSRLNSLVSVFRKNKRRPRTTSDPPTTRSSTTNNNTNNNNNQTGGIGGGRRQQRSRRNSEKRKQQQRAVEQNAPPSKEALELQAVVEQVLQRYPKSKCRTFADHKEFALAELTTRHSHTLCFTREKFAELQVLLETKLKDVLAEDETIAEYTLIHHLEEGQTGTFALNDVTEEDEEPYFVVKSSTKSLDARHPGSSKCLGPPNSRSHPSPKQSTIDKERLEDNDNTSSTESTEEQALLVDDLPVVDLEGHTGQYNGPICPLTRKPHGREGTIVYQTTPSPKNSTPALKSAMTSYHGEWNQGRWCGRGRYTKGSNGDVYEGHFCDDQKHGMGVYRYGDGKRCFEGRYVMGQRVEGTMIYGDDSVYKGQWVQGKRHGRGFYKFSDGSRYKGDFDRDRIHGMGQLVWPDGSKYVGEWCKGQRHGMGKEYTKEKILRYEGRWNNSQPAL